MFPQFVIVASLSALLLSSTTFADGGTPLPPDWVRYEEGPVSFDESATHVLLAESGEITMVGSSSSVSASTDVVIARYSATGDLLWSRRLDSPEHGTDAPMAAQAAPDGGLWFTILHNGVGETRAELVRFDAQGNTVWSHEMSVTGEEGVSAAFLSPRVAVDLNHGPARVYMTVGDAGGIRVMRFDDTGAMQWNELWESVNVLGDAPKGIAIDHTGSVYVAGLEGLLLGYITIAYDADGTLLFEDHEFGVGNPVLTDPLIEAHPDGGVVVSGSPETNCGAFEVRTWRLSPAGQRLWNVVVPDGPCGNSFGPTALAVAPDGRIAVTSQLVFSNGWRTFLYNAAGEQVWAAEWLNSHGGNTPLAIGFDPQGGVIVTGLRPAVPTQGGFGITRYTPSGIMDWEWEFANPVAGSGVALAVSPKGILAVGGASFDGSIGARAVTMRFTLPSACPADLTGDGTLDFFDISAFLNLFNAQDPAADFTMDGVHDFFDVSAFLQDFSIGCP